MSITSCQLSLGCSADFWTPSIILLILQKAVFGAGMAVLIPVARAASPIEENKASGGPSKPPPMRACDLPIYESPHADYVEFTEKKRNVQKASYLKQALATPVKAVREQIVGVWQQTDAIKLTVKDNYRQFQDRTDWIVKYLREEDNREVRYGAVAMGGLTGFIFSLRGGIFRRLFYTGAGTSLMGFVCFPDETKELAASNSATAKKYANIAYNFLYGVKPGDPQMELKVPELSFPKDFSQFIDMTVSVASSIKQAVLPPSKEEPKPEEKKN